MSKNSYFRNSNAIEYNYFSKLFWSEDNSYIAPSGSTNLHIVENTIFPSSAVGIWHEDGINHIVRFCDFESTKICSLLGSSMNIKYESCYYESIKNSFFEHSRRGSVSCFDVSNCTFDSKSSSARLFNLITMEGFAIHFLSIMNCYINFFNPNGLIRYTEKIRRLYWNSIAEHKPIFDIYPESNECVVISNGQNRYEIEVNINSNTIYQTNSFGTALSRFAPIGYSRTVKKEVTNGNSSQEKVRYSPFIGQKNGLNKVKADA